VRGLQYRINEKCISFYAPFRKSVHIQLDTIQYIGIDFGIVSGTRQFWIFFSTKPIPAELIHKIHKIPFNKNFMRIQYTKKKYEELLGFLPETKRKDFIKAATILRIYGCKE